jgi:hypothetical protein
MIGGTMELVASNNVRVAKWIVRKANFRARTPADDGNSDKRNSATTLSAIGGLLHAHFSIDDMTITDLVARGAHSVVRHDAHRLSICRECTRPSFTESQS